MTRKSLRGLLVRAARLLDVEAKAMLESCSVGEKPWACADCTRHPCNARKAYDKHVATAKELRDAAAKGIQA